MSDPYRIPDELQLANWETAAEARDAARRLAGEAARAQAAWSAWMRHETARLEQERRDLAAARRWVTVFAVLVGTCAVAVFCWAHSMLPR